MSRTPIVTSVFVAAALLTLPEPVLAYVGPGSGLTIIGAALAFVGTVLLMIVGFIWYPIKRLLRARARKPTPVN